MLHYKVIIKDKMFYMSYQWAHYFYVFAHSGHDQVECAHARIQSGGQSHGLLFHFVCSFQPGLRLDLGHRPFDRHMSNSCVSGEEKSTMNTQFFSTLKYIIVYLSKSIRYLQMHLLFWENVKQKHSYPYMKALRNVMHLCSTIVNNL